jgi:RNA polymerase sigma-70 factor, ECF subfamily
LNPVETTHLAVARAGNQHEFSHLTEPYRRELQLHCYRMLGSLQDAEDLVQETLLRAWRRLDTFEGRASLRAWLYKIATNACLDELDKRPRRALPVTVYPAADAHEPYMPPILEPVWLEPFPDDLLPELSTINPEARYTMHESVRLAFLTALQLLPPRQRAVLILSDVLDWRASEVAKLLDMTVSAVNSALHRARTTLAKQHPTSKTLLASTPTDDSTRTLLNQFVQAWEAADVTRLTALLKEDVILMMPPSPSWYVGRASVSLFLASNVFARETRGCWRLQATRANSQPAFGVYLRDETSGVYQAVGIEVLALEKVQIATMISFLNPAFVSYFGLPQMLGIVPDIP